MVAIRGRLDAAWIAQKRARLFGRRCTHAGTYTRIVGAWSWAALSLCACGRLGFDPVPGGVADDGRDGSTLSEPGVSPVACTMDGVLLCDGFEPNTPIAWQPITGNATVAMSTEKPHTGTRSLRAEGLSGRTVAFLAAPIAAVTTGPLHLRGFFYRTAATAVTDILLARVGNGVGNSEFFGIFGGANPGVTSGAQSSFTSPALAADTWVCVEMIVADNKVALRMDDVAVTSVALDAFGPYSEVAFGVVSDPGNPDSTYLVYVDDVVASVRPIGCAM